MQGCRSDAPGSPPYPIPAGGLGRRCHLAGHHVVQNAPPALTAGRALNRPRSEALRNLVRTEDALRYGVAPSEVAKPQGMLINSILRLESQFSPSFSQPVSTWCLR